MDNVPDLSHHVRPRNWKIVLLACIVLVIGLTRFYRAIAFAVDWEYILMVSQTFSWWFVLNASLVSGAGALLISWWLWIAHPLAVKAYWIWFGVYLCLFWVEKSVLSANAAARTNWLFEVGTQILLGFVSYWFVKSNPVIKVPQKDQSHV